MWKITGHQREVAFLEKSIREDTLVHAYLFSGPAGAGKYTLAIALARALNCQGEEIPCGTCSQCLRIDAGLHPDVQVLSVAGGNEAGDGRNRSEIGIDQVRDLQRWASLPPYEGKFRVFVVDGAHQLSVEAANCLLKVLEEPPDRIVFILATHQPERLPETVVSRCHHVRLHSVETAVVTEALHQKGVESEQARLLAVLCHGSPGIAFQAVADLEWQTIRREKMDALLALMRGGYAQRFEFAGKSAAGAAQHRSDITDVVEQWLGLWRDVLLMRVGSGATITNLDYSPELAAVATQLTPESIKAYITRIQQSLRHLRRNVNPQLVLEVLMLEMPSAGQPVSTARNQEK